MTYDRWDKRSYLTRLGDATSQWLNVALGNGMPDESLSGRAHRITTLEDSPPWRWRTVRRIADALFFWQDEHCAWAFWEDIYRSRSRYQAAIVLDREVGLRTVDAQCSLGDGTANTQQD